VHARACARCGGVACCVRSLLLAVHGMLRRRLLLRAKGSLASARAGVTDTLPSRSPPPPLLKMQMCLLLVFWRNLQAMLQRYQAPSGAIALHAANSLRIAQAAAAAAADAAAAAAAAAAAGDRATPDAATGDSSGGDNNSGGAKKTSEALAAMPPHKMPSPHAAALVGDFLMLRALFSAFDLVVLSLLLVMSSSSSLSSSSSSSFVVVGEGVAVE
jgi:hypothetical protein